MTDRDTFAAAALTGIMASDDRGDAAARSWKLADAMLRERERTNHDAVPEATATTTPLNKGAACNTATSGTGNTPSEAEIDALEFVVEEGRTASVDDYGILRSWLIRLRPEWESQSYDKSDEKRTNTTMSRDATPGEGSVQGEGTITDEERQLFARLVDRFESLSHFFDTPSGANSQAKQACDRDRSILKSFIEKLK